MGMRITFEYLLLMVSIWCANLAVVVYFQGKPDEQWIGKIFSLFVALSCFGYVLLNNKQRE